VSVAVLARAFRRSLSVQTFALHWAVFLSLLWTAFLWAVLLSLPLAAMNLVRRVARDGLAWTLQEFQQHYGPNNWESAWAEAHRPVPPSTRQPTVHDHQPPRSGSASQPTSPVTVQLDDYGSDWESAQSTVHDHQAPRSGGVPQPAASPVTVQLDDAQAVQPSSNQSGSASQPAAGPVTVQLTFAQLESMRVPHSDTAASSHAIAGATEHAVIQMPTLQCAVCERNLCEGADLVFFRRVNSMNGTEVHLMLRPEVPVPETFKPSADIEKGALQTWLCECGTKLGDTRPIAVRHAPMTAFKSAAVILGGQRFPGKKSKWPTVYNTPPFNQIEVRERDTYLGIQQ